jgi:demethylmenaquinone methyltransferase/2-methoxy-6-polyprenyl-1,4-benzoquinol methylase
MLRSDAMEKQYVRSLFDAIAHRYDLLNHLLSGGVDLYWRRKAIAQLLDLQPKRILDVATGTGDLAIAAMRLDPEEVVGVDIAEEMLSRARLKVARKGLAERIALKNGDAESLGFPEGVFDAALVAFGVRNFEDLNRGLSGIFRVLRPGGWLVILEFSRPDRTPLKQLYLFYFRHILPLLGRVISSHPEAYSYLPRTVMDFPESEDFLTILDRVGFHNLRQERLTGGIVTIYTGVK